MRITNVDERHFYEIEAMKNGWSLSELKRQFDSSLYERLALSKDKKAVARLAAEGQVVESPQDLIKDPYILEFLGLPELPEYSETELERYFRVDLVFFNRLLRCFVLFNLKIGELKIGSLQ